VHLLALAVWLGALMTGAIAAAIIFPSFRELDPRLPGFEGYDGEHWRLGAGMVQSRVFVWGDIVQLCAAGLAFFTLGLRLIGAGVVRAPRRAATALRVLGVGTGVVLVACNLMFLAPRMNPHLRAYWNLAREGQTAEARAEAAEFELYHTPATRLHGATSLAVLLGLVSGAWSLARKTDR